MHIIIMKVYKRQYGKVNCETLFSVKKNYQGDFRP